MQADIEGQPAFAYLKVALQPGETITAESGAMASMDTSLDMKAKFNGGFFSGLIKKFLGGESLFVQEFTNNTSEVKHVYLSPSTPGDMKVVEVRNHPLCLQPGAYIASTPEIKLKVEWAGFASFIAREGLFRLKLAGVGKVWYGAYGALLDKEVDGEYIVDTSHLVSYTPSLDISMGLSGGIFSSFFSGEGLITRVKGKGRITIQTRSMSGLVGWLNPKLPR